MNIEKSVGFPTKEQERELEKKFPVKKTNKERYFEVKMKNGNRGVLSESEIEKYKEFVDEVQTQFTEKEIAEIGFYPFLDEDTKSALGIKE